MKKYDLIIIGAGSAGLGCSGVANVIGLDTLLIEKDENNFGGDCTNFGCVPSKALIHIAHQFHAAKKAEQFGLESKGQADMKKVLDYIHQKQTIIKSGEDATALRKKGIAVVIGKAVFNSENSVEVKGKTYQASLIFLCTGSKPRMLDIPGMDQVKVYNNENIFYETMPEKNGMTPPPANFIFIGGGPIGCELGQAFSRLGSKVTIVNRGDRLLKKEPVKVSKILEEQFRKEGMTILNEAEVKRFEDGKAVIKIGEASKLVECDAVLISVGREVFTDGMGFEKAGIELTDKGKIKVNTYLQSTNKKVYVLGDAAGEYMFSHGAEKMVRQVWRNLLIPVFKKKNTLNDLSWVTFTDPQVAHFGLTEEQLEERNIDFYRQDQDMEEDDRAIVEEYRYGRMSMWLEGNSITKGGKKILSGSMIAPRAGELMQELELAKHAGIPVKKINNRVYPYPVAARINQKTTRGLLQGSFPEWLKKGARMVFRLFH